MNVPLVSTFLLSAATSSTPALPNVTFDARLLGTTATVRTIPTARREDAPEFYPPRSVRVTFAPNDDHIRELNVYPVAGLLAQYPEARGGVKTEINSLKALLKERPAPKDIHGEMPYLPLPFSGQVLNAAVKYVDFAGGRGVRFLVAFSFDVSPLSRDQVIYAYQGITNDGRYYVSMQYAVNLRELPVDAFTGTNKAVMDALNSGNETRAKTAWETYMARTKRQLDTLGNDPRLTKIDAFIRSVRVK